MRGIPCEKLKRLYAQGFPICPRCVEAYEAGSRLFALYLLRSFRGRDYDEDFHVAPTIFFMDKEFHAPRAKPAPAALCGITTAQVWYGKYWAASHLLDKAAPVSRLLTTYPVLDGVPWSEAVFHQHGIDLESELALAALSQIEVQSPS